MAANRAEIPTLTSENFDIDVTRAGLKGSPTKVSKTFTPSVKQGGIRITEETGVDSAKKLAQILADNGVI